LDEWQAYVNALKQGAPIRITLMPRVAMAELAGWLKRADVNLPQGHPNLRLGAMKFFLDGAVLPRTAAFKEPYADGSQTTVMMYEPDDFKRLFSACHQGGWQIATHAIGDAAIELVVDAAEEAQAAQPRPQADHRIEHCMITSPEVIQRMSRLGLIAAAQPEFIYHFGDKYYGALGDRAYQAMPFRSWLQGGVRVAFGSDQPVVDHDPIIGWRTAVNRLTCQGQAIGPQEGLHPLTALRCFTLEAALAGKDEEVGMLAPGKKADFAVLSHQPENILDEQMKVVATSRDLIKTL
jgi:predicted amidohydrolase YtcJ